jgi:hypothetical protein
MDKPNNPPNIIGLVKDLSGEMVKSINENNRTEYGDNWRERMLTEELPLTEVKPQKESWEDLRNLFIETSWSSAGILNYNESSYERAKKIVDALISQALLSDRARIVEELKQLKLLDNWTDTGSIWNSALDKAISIIKESR